MWQNVKYYVLAYAVMVAGALLSSAFQLLGDHFPVGHPISTVSANLSGVTIGGLFMVMGFLRDSRVEEERKRTEAERKRTQAEQERTKVERERADAAEARAEAAEVRAQAAEHRTQQERERVDLLLERYEAITESLLKRLDDSNGNRSDADSRE